MMDPVFVALLVISVIFIAIVLPYGVKYVTKAIWKKDLSYFQCFLIALGISMLFTPVLQRLIPGAKF